MGLFTRPATSAEAELKRAREDPHAGFHGRRQRLLGDEEGVLHQCLADATVREERNLALRNHRPCTAPNVVAATGHCGRTFGITCGMVKLRGFSASSVSCRSCLHELSEVVCTATARPEGERRTPVQDDAGETSSCAGFDGQAGHQSQRAVHRTGHNPPDSVQARFTRRGIASRRDKAALATDRPRCVSVDIDP